MIKIVHVSLLVTWAHTFFDLQYVRNIKSDEIEPVLRSKTSSPEERWEQLGFQDFKYMYM